MHIDGDAWIVLHRDGCEPISLVPTVRCHPEGVMLCEISIPRSLVGSIVNAELRLPFYHAVRNAEELFDLNELNDFDPDEIVFQWRLLMEDSGHTPVVRDD